MRVHYVEVLDHGGSPPESEYQPSAFQCYHRKRVYLSGNRGLMLNIHQTLQNQRHLSTILWALLGERLEKAYTLMREVM